MNTDFIENVLDPLEGDITFVEARMHPDMREEMVSRIIDTFSNAAQKAFSSKECIALKQFEERVTNLCVSDKQRNTFDKVTYRLGERLRTFENKETVALWSKERAKQKEEKEVSIHTIGKLRRRPKKSKKKKVESSRTTTTRPSKKLRPAHKLGIAATIKY